MYEDSTLSLVGAEDGGRDSGISRGLLSEVLVLEVRLGEGCLGDLILSTVCSPSMGSMVLSEGLSEMTASCPDDPSLIDAVEYSGERVTQDYM